MLLLQIEVTRKINFPDAQVKWDPCSLVEHSAGLNGDIKGPVCICINKKVTCVSAVALCLCKAGYYWTGFQCLEERACSS